MKDKIISILNKKIKNSHLLLFFIFLIGFILRIYNLTILPPYTDEYNHLLAVKNIIEDGFTDYDRAYLLSIIIKTIIQNVNLLNFDQFLFWSRVPGVIFSSISIFPIYFLGKKIKKEIGIISAFLWAISPWSIGIARTIREYSLYTLIILIILALTVNLFDLIKRYNKKNNFKISLTLIIISFFFFYSYIIDHLSTLKIGIAILLISFIYFLIFHFKKIGRFIKTPSSKKLLIFLIFFLSIPTLIIIIKIFLKNPHFSILNINNNYQYLSLFFCNKSQVLNWWREIPGCFTPVLFLLIGLIWSFTNKNKDYFLHLFIFLGLLIFYTTFLERYFRPRYISYLLPFYSILIASGLYALIENLNKKVNKKNKIFYLILTIAIIYLSFNPKNSVEAPFIKDGSPSRLTNEWHENMAEFIDQLENDKQKNNFFIISSIKHYINMSQARFDISKDKTYLLEKKQDLINIKKINEIINKEDCGMLIIKKSEYFYITEVYEDLSLFPGNKKIEKIIEKNDGVLIYKWSLIQDL